MRTVLKKDEKILIIIRQHWLRLVLPFFAWLMLTIILIWWLQNATALIIILLSALYPMIEYINWKNNIWCVTSLPLMRYDFFTPGFNLAAIAAGTTM